MTAPGRRPRSASSSGPMIVIVAIALVPALLLWAVWHWASASSAAAADAVPPLPDTPVVVAEPQPALST
ncbi:MAG: hypothetical protein ABIO83_03005, partial [Ilumatobacteraceae bacterium]